MNSRSKFEYDSRSFEGSIADRRAAAQRDEEDRIAQRKKFLAALTSPHHEPQRRIRLWEQLHAMHLPQAAEHRLIAVIAAQTALSVEQVHAEQARRVTAVVASNATVAPTS